MTGPTAAPGPSAAPGATPEFSRIIEIDALDPSEPRVFRHSADAAECAALARRLDLPALNAFDVTVTIGRVRGGAHIEITFSARLIQTCVVTNLRFESTVSDTVAVDALTEPEYGRRLAAIDAAEPEEAPEPPELLVDGRVDVGELATEYLSLAIDPYPRGPEAPAEAVEREVFALRAGTAGGEKPREHPFAKLAVLKQQGGKGRSDEDGSSGSA
ncbi:hypothetical protein P7L78_16010 [Tistrella bauzanensis]|jgi:hypothetical protein|uniref:DUF177 domain-containing protein n=1 Tax=Tistrella arctica TaxID=3133430 RepID=A0ABU9YEK8_9PROT